MLKHNLYKYQRHFPNKNRYTLSFKIGTYTFHGLYLPPPNHNDNIQCKELPDQLEIDDHTIIFGDFNARSKVITQDHQNNSRGLHVPEPWSLTNDLLTWNGALARGQHSFRTNAGYSIIDIFMS